MELRDQERILIEDAGASSVVYTPPRGRALIISLLDNLVTFLREPGELDPLIKMAVAHYQFEAIHPFMDGNGRTGRILNILILLQAGLLDIPVLYLSRFIIQNKQEYYRRLRRVTEDQGHRCIKIDKTRPCEHHCQTDGCRRALNDHRH